MLMASAFANAFSGFGGGFEMNPKKTASHTRQNFRSAIPNYQLFEQRKAALAAQNLTHTEYQQRIRALAEELGV